MKKKTLNRSSRKPLGSWTLLAMVGVLLIAFGILYLAYTHDEHDVYAAYWLTGPEASAVYKSDDFDDFKQHEPSFEGQLIDFEIHLHEEEEEYVGVWSQIEGEHTLERNIALTGYGAWREDLGNEKQVIDIEVYTENGIQKVAALYRSGSEGDDVELGLDPDAVAVGRIIDKIPYKLIDFELYADQDSGELKVAGIWHPGTDVGYFEHWKEAPDLSCVVDEEEFNTTWDCFHNTVHSFSMAESSRRLKDFELYASAGGDVVAALWYPGDQLDWLQVSTHWDHLDTTHGILAQGLDPNEDPEVPKVHRRLIDIEILEPLEEGSELNAGVISSKLGWVGDWFGNENDNDPDFIHVALHDDDTVGPPEG